MPTVPVASPRFVDTPAPGVSRDRHERNPKVKKWKAKRAAFVRQFPTARYFDPKSDFGTLDQGDGNEEFVSRQPGSSSYISVGAAKKVKGGYQVISPAGSDRLFPNRRTAFKQMVSRRTGSLVDTVAAEGGFTYDTRNSKLVKIGSTAGYAVAVPGTERLLGPAGLTRDQFAARFADTVRAFGPQLAAGAYVGGWLSPDRGYLIELSEIHRVSRDDAVKLGTNRNQEGILDLATGEFIPTGGTGDS